MIDDAGAAAGPAPAVSRRGGARGFRVSPMAWAGAAMLAAGLFAAPFAPLLARYDPVKTDLANSLQPPSSAHLLGTDNFGRDILTRLLYGARGDLQIALLPTAGSCL